jgi:hypothetical protein
MLHRTIYVYKHVPWEREGFDPSNGGITGRLNQIEVFSAESTDEEIRAWCEKHGVDIHDVCRLNKRMLWGEKHYTVEPVVKPKGTIGPMFGGSYASSSDATWAQILGERVGRPIPIHDRFETPEVYEMLSR